MSSIVERLTEGVVNRDMRAEGHALLSKWEKTGLLEGLGEDRHRQSMARLLENQAKELLRESSSMGAGDVEGFAAVAFPIVRRVFAGLIANDLVSVQPMSLPSGLIFFMDFVFSPNLGDSNSQTDRFGNLVNQSIYGTNRVGSQITGGVGLYGNEAQDLSGPRTASPRGYSYSSPTGSATCTGEQWNIKAQFDVDGNVSNANKKLIVYDPDVLSLSSSTGTAQYRVLVIDALRSQFGNLNNPSAGAQADLDNLGAFQIGGTALNTAIAGTGDSNTAYNLVRRLTTLSSGSGTTGGPDDSAVSASSIRFVITTTSSTSTMTVGGDLVTQVPIVDDFASGTGLGSIKGQTEWGLEGNDNIPEIDIKVDSVAVTAQTKKLKAKWTPELGQDLNAYHNLDAEVELTSILSEQIALEIDREILADLINGATAGTYYWSRSPGMFLDRTSGVEIGANTKAPDFTGTVSEWYETLIETINDVSAQIHRKTLRGGANFIVCGPEVANVLEFTAGYRASVTADDDKGSVGAVKVGSLSKKFDVIVDPYFLRNVVLVGRRGSSFLESGYVYAPYVPLQTTPTIFGPEDFVPRKGVMTRYAKKMVRPDMYGLVIIRGLLGESGA